MHRHTYRTITIILVLVIALIYIYPTIGWTTLSEEERQERLAQWAQEDRVYEEPSFFGDAAKAIKRWAQFDRDMVINLGLDLQGGIQMIVGLDMDSVDPDIIQDRLDRGMTEEMIVEEYQMTALRTVQRRVNEFEAKEPLIRAYGDKQIQIQLPGEKDVERAKSLIMRTAYLTFHIALPVTEVSDLLRDIEEEFPGQLLPYLQESFATNVALEISPEYIDAVRSTLEDAQEREDLIPENRLIAFSDAPSPYDQNQNYLMYVLDAEELMTGESLQDAVARPDQESLQGAYQILFEFDSQGGRQFGEVTEANIGRHLAIVVDGVVAGAPVINSRITQSGSISGNFSAEEARDLAIALSSGSMPARIQEEFTGVVGATLGQDSIRKGVFSALVGLALVVVFMLVYYRVGGLIANLALLFNAVLILAALAYIDATLTLPGIAGLILTIGMAVDANVLIFERIREELLNGRSLMASIENGFQRARITILDANITTLIAAAVLMQFGTGPIESFAVTLSIGVICSVFTALIVSRAVFDFLGERNLIGGLSMMSFFKPESHVAFMKGRKVAIVVSIAVIAVGVVLFGVRQAGAGMFGVDFTTGTNMVVNLHGEEDVNVADVRAALINAGFEEPTVQKYESDAAETQNRFLIGISDLELAAAGNTDPEASPEAVSEVEEAVAETDPEAIRMGEDTISSKVQAALTELATPAPVREGGMTASAVELERVETVGPAVGRQLRYDAIRAIIYALIFIIAYVAFRFEVKFAFGAVAALIHDVLITLGIFALLGRQISLPVVAALLTIIGYSLNDTIVVYDRIREDLRLYRGRGLSLLEVMDLSINQTLSRTILTSGTTLLVVLVLFIFGGEVINDFALALLVGIIVGTYSSIYVASPAVYYLGRLRGPSPHVSGDAGPTGRRKKSKRNSSKGHDESEGEITA